ncbi:hypothetical protein D9V96_019525 [Zobellia laminariae]|uniref:hypothetical protein n=1 Tax=Zobellia laminariae TaxID=248906 RepID=UPI0012D96EA1|nr:hypothetical protein [Zobellia laminariae]
MYKVIWFEDEHETLEDIKDDCLVQDIRLIGFENAVEGLEVLLENPKQFDAVLLDGLFFKSSKNTGDDVSEEAFGSVAKALLTLKAQGVLLPWFIYSGQKSFVKDNNTLVNIFKEEAFASGKVFDKSNDKDLLELCIAIKEAANEQPITRVRQEFSEAFQPFEIGILERKHEHLLLDILVNYNEGDFRKKNINVQRDLLEAIWKSLHFTIPCIPESFFDERLNNKPNHEWCTMFFENRFVINTKGEHKINNNVSKGIGSTFRGLKESVNELSHLSDNEIVKLPYTTNTFLILQLLEWLPQFVESNYSNYI